MAELTIAEELRVRSPDDILKFMVAQICWKPDHTLFVHGSHIRGMKQVTDFDFSYDCSRHVVRGETHITMPGGRTHYCSVDVLQAMIKDSYTPAVTQPGVYQWLRTWMGIWSPGVLTVRSGQGIEFTRSFQHYPLNSTISALAQRIGYCGEVGSFMDHEDQDPLLVSFNGTFTPSSERCMHVHTVWKFATAGNSASTPDLDSGMSITAYERTLQLAMLDKRTGVVEERTSSRDSQAKSSEEQGVSASEQLPDPLQDWVDVYPPWGYDEWEDGDETEDLR